MRARLDRLEERLGPRAATLNNEALVSLSRPGAFRSLQEAAAQIAIGGRIVIASGRYEGNWTAALPAHVSVVGQDPDGSVVIEGPVAIEARHDGAQLRNLVIKTHDSAAPAPALRIVGGHGMTIEGCEIHSPTSALELTGALEGSTVKKCRLVGGSGPGVHVIDCVGLIVSDCDVSSRGDAALAVVSQGRCDLTRCRIHDSGTGLRVTGSGTIVAAECEIRSCTESGLVAADNGRFVLSRIDIHDIDHAGISTQDGGSASVWDCEIATCGYAGVEIAGGGRIDVRVSRLKNNGYGVAAEAGAAGSVTGCTFAGNSVDTYTHPASAVKVYGNVHQDPGASRRYVVRTEGGSGIASNGGSLERDPKPLKDLLHDLDQLVGLAAVKHQVRGLIAFLRVQAAREERGFADIEMSHHLVFVGNPGTGKTTIARLVAQMYRAMGLLARGHLVEVDRSGLVAEYVGQTVIKTTRVIDSAVDGVLFIDEAYALAQYETQSDFGREAIDALVKRMEDDRERLVVIVAGYPDLMKTFLDSNPGLKSRFPRTISFPDYTTDELLEIMRRHCQKHDYTLAEGAEEKLREILNNFPRGTSFGNARLARNLFEAALNAQALRLETDPSLDDTELTTLFPGDFVTIVG